MEVALWLQASRKVVFLKVHLEYFFFFLELLAFLDTQICTSKVSVNPTQTIKNKQKTPIRVVNSNHSFVQKPFIGHSLTSILWVMVIENGI